jgi:hypothetical protein
MSKPILPKLTEERAWEVGKRLQVWADRNPKNKWVQEIVKLKIQELNIRLTYTGSIVLY